MPQRSATFVEQALPDHKPSGHLRSDAGSRGKPFGTARFGPPLSVRVREACRLTGIGRSKLYELIRAGEISTFKIGGMTLISTAELERFLAAQIDGSGQQRQT